MRYPKNNDKRLYLAEEKTKDSPKRDGSIKYGRYFHKYEIANGDEV